MTNNHIDNLSSKIVQKSNPLQLTYFAENLALTAKDLINRR